jgi:homoserine kinase
MRVLVRVPATSANLGPGFDVLALALALHNEVTAEEWDGVSVTVTGEGAGALPAGADNVVARGVRAAFEAAGRPFRGVALSCVNRIPPSRGLGSSAAAWVAGLVAGNALAGGALPREALLDAAARAEGHPDNVAAALLGGLTVSCATGDRITAISLPVPASVGWVVLIPEAQGSTREARAVLPAEVSRADAVFNLQRVSLLLAALGAGRADLLPTALDDRLHQPARWKLFPWLPAAVAAARGAGALGCVLSGAGPALLAAVAGPGEPVARAMEAALRAEGGAGRAVPLAVDGRGATCERVA